ncbi:Uncharacterised protein [Peptostreptococcus anaerobius]|uniref:Uncharacterized protein n=1 Tax=Peptostreptococcus anaerobius TaxID=1261 RepID=A0A379CHG5_9FIRM|nr:hypothetical protein [Peptostreptococcus anaerobius]EKX92917.1 hypothetical protein HMPREF9998_01008 [Peptostreptococcus anaerobius VPI 4330 = DSM 2949]SFN41532.1 hypothetical protein SAMN05660467_02093 [Peptostreptococcus anaerobius]SUB61902.1 Uncharacterised protein [Peptostreptococcus anaerobius]
MTDKKENSIDPELDKFEEMFDSEENLELEKKLEELIDKEIKKRIVRTTKSLLINISLLIFTLIILINPIVKSFYPNFVDLSAGKPINQSIEDKITTGLKKFWYGTIGFFTENAPIIDNSINKNWLESDLSEMVKTFIEISNPSNSLSYLGMRDRGYGRYDFYLNIDGPFNKSITDRIRPDSNHIKYIRGEVESDIILSMDPYDPNNKNESIENIKNLPDSTLLYASIGLKEPSPILNLLRNLNNKYDAEPIWLRVVSDEEYDSIKKENNLFLKTKNRSKLISSTTELGIRPEMVYKKTPVSTKLDDGSIDQSYEVITIRDDIDKMTEASLKKAYLNKLKLIEKNRDIFNTFCSIVQTQQYYDEEIEVDKYTRELSFRSQKIGDPEQKEDIYPFNRDFYRYKDDIEKSNTLKTNLYTIVADKNTLLKILEDDLVDRVSILDDKLSLYSSTRKK